MIKTSDKNITIFAATQPGVAEEKINETEKAEYLNCKFWKQSFEEAQLFYLYYLPLLSSSYESIHRLVGILSGEFLILGQSLNTSHKKINKVILGYQSQVANNGDLSHDQLDDITHLQPIIEEITNDLRNKEIILEKMSIEDVFTWAKTKPVFSSEIIKQAKAMILATRKAVFNNKIILDKSNIKIIKPILSKISWLYYEDARALLFPDRKLIDELIEAAKNDGLQATSSNKNSYYFFTKTLIKWLMKKNYLSQWLVDEFEELKIESIKESAIECTEHLHSLTKLNNSKNDILQHTKNGKLPIYLRFPRSHIEYKQQDNVKSSIFAKTRYKGLGQLKLKREDDTDDCALGGLTIDMLFENELPSLPNSYNRLDMPYEIEFCPTEEEAKYGLQPSIKIPGSRIERSISDDNLMILESDLKKTLIKIGSDSFGSEVKSEVIPLNDETRKTYELGKQTREQRKNFSERGTKEKSEKAKEYWEPKLELALQKAQEKSGKYTASDLARIIIENYSKDETNVDPELKFINQDTFRKKIGKDTRIKNYLKAPSRKALSSK